ncbi:MAG: FIST N-terminal domain-containing protein [Actinomycetota bacterium]|nr:FIST N-terminal domain-containing protein [Actinomycetota bacterium]
MASSRYAVALSQHPDAQEAVAEVVGHCLDRLGPAPDLAILFTSGAHVTSTPLIARAVRRLLRPHHLLGGTAVATVAHRQELEEGPSLVLWAGRTGPVETFRLAPHPVQPRLPERMTSGPVVVLADPFNFDAAALVGRLGPQEVLVGGLTSAAGRPGGNHLVLDDEHFSDGAVGVALPDDLDAAAVVATGCHPVGDPMVVTDAEGPLLRSLAGRPALDRLERLLADADEATRNRLRRGLHLGVVLDEHREAFGPGDFLIRGILGVQRETRSLAVGAEVAIGTTVQFQVRDAAAATADLERRLAPFNAETALVFTCNGRGSHLFGMPGHDAERLVDSLGTTDVAGMACAGELGPVAGQHHLHGFTASTLLLGSRAT